MNVGDIYWSEEGPWRVYWSKNHYVVGVHRGDGISPDQRLEYTRDLEKPLLAWHDCKQASKHNPIARQDFIDWLNSGGT